MFASCLHRRCNLFGRCGQSIDGDRARLGAAIEADAATGAIVARIARRMHAVMAEFRREFETLGGAGLYT
jgi:hypothetical protein